MQAYRTILPAKKGYDIAIYDYELNLAATFGGFTRVEAKGAWIDPRGNLIEDINHVYDVALEPHQVLTLRQLTLATARTMQEQAVYFQTPGGNVEIINVAAEFAKKAVDKYAIDVV